MKKLTKKACVRRYGKASPRCTPRTLSGRKSVPSESDVLDFIRDNDGCTLRDIVNAFGGFPKPRGGVVTMPAVNAVWEALVEKHKIIYYDGGWHAAGADLSGRRRTLGSVEPAPQGGHVGPGAGKKCSICGGIYGYHSTSCPERRKGPFYCGGCGGKTSGEGYCSKCSGMEPLNGFKRSRTLGSPVNADVGKDAVCNRCGQPFRVAGNGALPGHPKDRLGDQNDTCPGGHSSDYRLCPEGARITTTYTTVTPGEEDDDEPDIENGWEDALGHSCEPDEFDKEEGLTRVDLAVEFLRGEYATEQSSSHFHPGIWYHDYPDQDFRTGESKEKSFHLEDFTPAEEEEIFRRMTARNR